MESSGILNLLPKKPIRKTSNLAVTLISEIKNGNWSISKNYITLTSSGESVESFEFQFAIENEILKLLKMLPEDAEKFRDGK
jgi:hypothetical protein